MKIHCKYDELVSIIDLKKLFNPENPNDHPDDQIDVLAEIIEYQGVRREAIISNRSNILIQGHGRILAVEKLGYEHFPVTFQDYEDADQEYADMVADNAINQRSILDFSKINMKVPDLGPDFNMQLLGIKDFVVEAFDRISEKEFDENLDTEHECPKCGYKWS